MYHEDDDQYSLSLVSTGGIETTYAHTEDDTDEFELIVCGRDSDIASDCDPSSSTSTSVLSVAYAHEFKYGRRYHGFKSGRYPLPNDVGEHHREDARHALMLQLTGGRLFLSGIKESPSKIIDIGTGKGTWAIDVADLYPGTNVIGTDLSPCQETWAPPNVQMLVEDCEDLDWLYGSDVDLVHFRGVAGTIRDLDAVVANIFKNTRAGAWVEFQEFGCDVLCDDGTMKQDDSLRLFIDTCAQGMRTYGCAGFGRQDFPATLRCNGFRNIEIEIKKVPISSWARDENLKTAGTLMKLALYEWLDALAAKPLAALGISEGERKSMVKRARTSLEQSKAHRYMNCYICYGQR